MLNRRLTYCCLFIVSAIIIYIIYWFVIAGGLKSGFKNWINETNSRSILATYRSVEFSGFPLSINLLISAPELKIPTNSVKYANKLEKPKWFWKGDRVELKIRPWDLDALNCEFSGSQYLALITGTPLYEFSTKENNILIEFEGLTTNWPESMRLRLMNLSLAEKKQNFEAKIGSVLVEVKKIATEGMENSILKIGMRLNGVSIPKYLSFPLGNHITELSTRLRVIGLPEPSLDLRTILNWRNTGGVVEIDSVLGKFKRLKMSGSGTLALDKGLQPLLAMSTKLEGLISTIDMLKQTGYLSFKKAQLLKLALGFLGQNSDNNKNIISLPISIQDRELSVGPVKLMEIPMVRWPNS